MISVEPISEKIFLLKLPLLALDYGLLLLPFFCTILKF
jgi:hypothetical protein